MGHVALRRTRGRTGERTGVRAGGRAAALGLAAVALLGACGDDEGVTEAQVLNGAW